MWLVSVCDPLRAPLARPRGRLRCNRCLAPLGWGAFFVAFFCWGGGVFLFFRVFCVLRPGRG